MTTGFWLSVVFAVGWLPTYVFRTEDRARALGVLAPGERFWTRLTLVVMSLHVTVACAATALALVPAWRAWLSIAVFVLGFLLWFWARTQIGPLRQRRLPTEAPEKLRSDGMFGLVRHPLYLSYLIITGAPVLAAGRVSLVLGWCACAVVLAGLALQEERRLKVQLGARYTVYCARVPRLIPFLW